MGRVLSARRANPVDLPGAYEASDAFSEAERAVLLYADAMSDTPAEVPDAVFAGLRAHFDERQIVELTAAIAWEQFRARYNRALGIESEGFAEGGFCVLPLGE
ncbi:MAG: carboxymuconolactone decarboxylase family protein [Gemmatimonadota bacterium]